MKTDEELIVLSKQGSDKATQDLFERYKSTIQKISRGYFLFGADDEDLIQEGMIGLYKAVLGYDKQKEASFKTFANICIRRNILSAIKKSNTQKNKVLNESLSLSGLKNFEEEDEGQLYLPTNTKSVDQKLIEQENLKEVKKQIQEKLSSFEISVLSLYLKGMSYEEMAKHLDAPKKSVDNALSRIKSKLKFLK